MRWPWQRERIETPADDVGGELSPHAAEPPRVPPAGWAFLPPLQRTTGNMQLTSEPDDFTGALAAWGDPSFTSPMSHLVSASAPPGIIDIDGGGPVRGHGAYPPSSVDMTLLPPPVPGSRTPARKAGNAGSLHRSASDAGPSAGASGPVGPALTAAVGTFPVLQLHAAPPEEARPHAEDDSSPEQAQAQVQPEQESDESEALTGTDEPAPPATEGIAGSVIAPTLSQPIRTVGSTSDGNATYVPLPPPPMQRAQTAMPDAALAKWKVPPASKLGLGMPLAYSEPEAPPEPLAAAALRHVSPPVQRSAAPEPSGAAPAVRPGGNQALGSDGDHDRGTGAAGPGTGPISGGPIDGTVPLALVSPPTVPQPSSALPIQAPPTVSVQATDAGLGDAITGTADESVVGPADVEPLPVVSDRVMDSAAERGHEGPADVQENHEPAMPLEPAVSPLLSAAGPNGPLGSTGQGGASPTNRVNDVGASGMPVVSRFRPAAPDKPAPEEAPGEPAFTDSASEAPAGSAPNSAAPRSSDPRTAAPDSGWRDTAQDPGREPITGRALTREAPASNAAVPLQRAAQPTPGHPVTISSAHETITTPQSSTADQSRTHRPGGTAPPTPLVFRMARTTTGGSTPDSLQRLTEMPAAQQYAPLSARPLSAATAWPTAHTATSTAAQDAVPSTGSHPEPDATPLPPSALAGSDYPESSGGLVYEPGALQLSIAGATAWPVEPLEATAAVGRSIQRTLSSEGAASAAGGVPRPSSDSWRSAELVSPAAGPTAQTGGRGPVKLQRSAASTPAFPHAAGLHVEGSDLGSGNVSGAASKEPSVVGPGFDNASEPTALALAALPAYRTGHDTAAKSDATVQRDAADSGAGLRAGVSRPRGSVGGASIAASGNSSDTEPSVQTDAGSAPAGAAGPVPGAAASSSVGKQATGAPAVTPEQLEELAKRLTGPLIRRIKAEMLLDRERRGLRTDVN